jgi:phospholipid/cholesterol/gamma-HCH transport system permease protein
MASTDLVPRRPTQTPAAPPIPRSPGASAARLQIVGGIVRLGAESVVCWFTPPFTWWREAVEQAWILVKRCVFPTAVSCFVFAFGAAGIQGGSLFETLGATDRLGSLFSVASLREFVPWVAGMVVAGVAGTAIAADLGARRVREELDALTVLGIRAVRTIVAPRILALTLLMPALNIMGLVFSTLAGLVAIGLFNGSTTSFFENFKAGFTGVDLAANIVKTLGFGFIVATICCYKGMNASGGSEGVGRAVNQAVVLSFIAVWVFNFAFNASYQSIFPSAQDIR